MRATRLGRAPANDVCLPDPGVSGLHARIAFEGGNWVLIDEGSRNGSFVNDEPHSRCVLHDGDTVRLGNVALTFHTTGETAGPTLMWRKGLPDQPVGTPVPNLPLESPPEVAVEDSSLEGLFSDEPDYNPITALGSERLATLIQPAANAEPEQLARRLHASYEVSRATAATLDTSEILDRVLTALFGIFAQADRAFILLVDPATHDVSTAAVKRRVKRKAVDVPISQTAVRQAMERREAVLCRDAAADARFAGAQSIMSLGIRSMMIAPLVFRDEVLGAVHIDSVTGVREFSEADLELLSVAASDVAACLANARLHEKVVASERLAAVGQTLAGLTHCIKNILQGIKGGAYILDLGLDKDNIERVHKGWEMVRRNNAFMEELVHDLLTFSKDRVPEYAAAELNTLCSEICELCAERARTKDVPLSFEPDAALGTVQIDPKGIRRCLLNLVMNAVDACSGSNATVTVSTRAPGEDKLARIIVRDTGCGMSQETLDKLFTVFFSTKGSKGTGLGLPVTRKIVEEHGGRLDVESREGEGTSFTICLPIQRPATETATNAEGNENAGTP